ncbi:MAG: hypothetical protein DRN81_03640 [Thermoproteota archaeon]|nr:MAG: hypothetical protein DRN81_03640 [Candidatus Korarchaeota archaeon]
MTDKETFLEKIGEFVKALKGQDVAIVDVGDVEVVKVGSEFIVTLPKGKEVFLVHRGSGLAPSTVKKLSDVIE